MSQETMTVVMLVPGERAKISQIGTSLEAMQAAVGNGWIEAIYPFEDPNCCLVCNEEGKINGLPLNRALYDEAGENMIDIIAGPCFVCDCSGEDFSSLPEEKQEQFCQQFLLPEIFFRLPNGKIKAVPYEPKEERQQDSLSAKMQSAAERTNHASADTQKTGRNVER